MGQLRFVIPRPERIAHDAPQRAYFAGVEGVPWECRNSYQDGLLSLERDTRESGNLHCPWSVPGHGEWMLSSASLMERVRPYNLPVELARGTINRLRNQSHLWQTAGMQLGEPFLAALKQAMLEFGKAASSQSNPVLASDHADTALTHAFAALKLLGQDYTNQVLAIRRGNGVSLSTLMGARIEAVPEGAMATSTLAAFNTALLAPCWREIEATAGQLRWDSLDRQVQWCKDHGLRICMGPLISLDVRNVPDWLYLWEGDFEELEGYIGGFVQAVVQRYKGRIQLWDVAARMNLRGSIDFSEEERLKLVVEALQKVRALDSRTPTIVSFDQPWAEYIAREDQELSPLHFADTLARGELGLAGIGLEMNIGYTPGGTQPRDCLEVSRQLDRWTQIGLPLCVFLTIPSSLDADPLAKLPSRPLPLWMPSGMSARTQQATVDWLFPLLLAKQAVQAIIWNQLRDDLPHDFPHGGLFDARRRARPALQSIIDFRRQFIG
jgi:hypothetical protein